ncbi:hypothetical protein [Bacillus clarus]|uniref:hypothetical protein n=1 Tax=Bacillus clarus TaxID=2338372 RepID=UPI001377B52A|nr:hypothetical protein [Bacillus clarus]
MTNSWPTSNSSESCSLLSAAWWPTSTPWSKASNMVWQGWKCWKYYENSGALLIRAK